MSFMIRTLVVLDDVTTEPLGIEVKPAHSITTLTKRAALHTHTMGQFYDLIFVHDECRLLPDERALYEKALMPWGAILTISRP